MVGRQIDAVEVLHQRPLRRHLPGADDFASRLAGQRIASAQRRGKYLWLPLDGGEALVAHLGMSGQLLVQPPGAEPERHLRARLSLADVELRFVDQRMFGWLTVDESDPPGLVDHIALDPLDPAFDADLVARRIRRSRAGVKRLLLDQTVASGIGNIYADEGLWLAGVHGERPGYQLSRKVVLELLAACAEVMSAALAQGGTSFDALYVNVNGESGYFERSLNVYGREGEACRRCGGPITRMSFANRSSHFCRRCQPVPRSVGRAQLAPRY